MPSFSRLVRFVSDNGNIYYGEPVLSSSTRILDARQARVIHGDIYGKHTVTDQVKTIQKLLAPLDMKDVKTVRCLGLNYEQHAKESNMPIPKFPVLFYKPVTSLSGPTDPIPVHPLAQQGTGLDYECELVAVIGTPCADVPADKALDYVLGYAIGNDVSHRDWQLKHGGGQWSLGKGFDGWAPFGPGIVTSELIPDPQALTIKTILNGKVVQESNTKDMIFSVKETIAFLSQGTTLQPGDIIFTGTPQGVGMGRKPQLWLKDGDVVEVSLENVGSCINKVEFTKKEGAKL
ncbi:Fumarylacetoacetase-like protein [Tricladium varicosporioides]|nr:Fumarylacetoacetase-like protein [Hymenoscyphus varicosporioides]